MTYYATRDQARSEARMEAARTLERLNIDQSQPIDIFKIIQDEGIWLMFQPLTNLYGAYMPQEEAIGIILHSKHPLSLQRFTAAHEFGHYVLQHPVSLDDEGMIARGRDSSDLREVAADAFAANFLMPLQLVNTMLVRMGLSVNPGPLTALQVYQLSLDMGVSYAAAVNHLATLKKIPRASAEDLRKQPPKKIKTLIAGTPIENSWADIWVLDEKNTGKRLNLRVYDELRISLPETPSTGYIWTLEDSNIPDMTKAEAKNDFHGLSALQRSLFVDSENSAPPTSYAAPLALVNNEFEPNTRSGEQMRFGAGGNRYLTLRSLRPGEYALRLLKRRPWQMTSPPIETFEAYLDISQKPTGDREHGLSPQQQNAPATIA